MIKRLVHRELKQGQSRPYGFHTSLDVLNEYGLRPNGTDLAHTIARNTPVQVIAGTIYSPETQRLPELRDNILPEALRLRVEAKNRVFRDVSKYGSIAAAYVTRFAILGATGDIFVKLAHALHGEQANWTSIGLKLLVGSALTFYIAKKLIPPVTRHVARVHSEHMLEQVTDIVKFRFDICLPERTRQRIFDAVQTSCPHFPKYEEFLGRPVKETD